MLIEKYNPTHDARVSFRKRRCKKASVAIQRVHQQIRFATFAQPRPSGQPRWVTHACGRAQFVQGFWNLLSYRWAWGTANMGNGCKLGEEVGNGGTTGGSCGEQREDMAVDVRQTCQASVDLTVLDCMAGGPGGGDASLIAPSTLRVPLPDLRCDVGLLPPAGAPGLVLGLEQVLQALASRQPICCGTRVPHVCAKSTGDGVWAVEPRRGVSGREAGRGGGGRRASQGRTERR